uniref:Uncharacterized protein n=1 Tax=Anguilla anguilla TaxID=7936 RepID=A0A0E9VCD0_ANGAN
MIHFVSYRRSLVLCCFFMTRNKL